jgi:hypothetical protein
MASDRQAVRHFVRRRTRGLMGRNQRAQLAQRQLAQRAMA